MESFRQRLEQRRPERQPVEVTEDEWEDLCQKARLSIPTALRIPAASIASSAVGMGLGLVQGSKMAGLRFRAEHAHKLPTTTTGWYMYHKSKNYNVALGGIREGFKMGAKVSVWTTALLLAEAWWDQYRGATDAFNTVVASVAAAGAFSLWRMFICHFTCVWLLSCLFDGLPSFLALTASPPIDRFPLAMAARTTKTAIVVGIVYGGLQDIAGAVRGRHIGYIDYMQHQLGKGDDRGLTANA